MVNILAGLSSSRVIQRNATPSRVASEAIRLLENPRRYARLRAELLALRTELGRPGAAGRAAQAILTEAES